VRRLAPGLLRIPSELVELSGECAVLRALEYTELYLVPFPLVERVMQIAESMISTLKRSGFVLQQCLTNDIANLELTIVAYKRLIQSRNLIPFAKRSCAVMVKIRNLAGGWGLWKGTLDRCSLPLSLGSALADWNALRAPAVMLFPLMKLKTPVLSEEAVPMANCLGPNRRYGTVPMVAPSTVDVGSTPMSIVSERVPSANFLAEGSPQAELERLALQVMSTGMKARRPVKAKLL